MTTTITVKAAILANAIATIRASVSARSSLQILTHVMIEASNRLLTITGNNLECQLTVSIPVEDGGSFAATADARKLYEITRNLNPAEDVALVSTEKMLQLRQARSRFRLSSLPVAEYPRLAEPDVDNRLAIGKERLLTMLEEVTPAMAANDVRYYLNGAYLAIGDSGLVAVASDGHRMTVSIDTQTTGTKGQEIILPRAVVPVIHRLLSCEDGETVEIGFSSQHILIKHGSHTLIGKLVDGRFPDYRKVMPTAAPYQAHVVRAELKDAAQRMLVVANPKKRGVRLLVTNNQLTLEAEGIDGEESSESLAIDYSGDDTEIAVDAGYLQDALATLEGELVTLNLAGPDKVIVLTGERSGTTCLVMPMRLGA